jgi:two-component system, LytTR family, response regulator
MSIRCVAIDDEPMALVLLRGYISKIPALNLVSSFDDAISASEFLRHNKVDLLFLDINMPDVSGVELARSLGQRPMIIFTTAHKEYAIDGFELDAVDYLLKPISFDRFSKAVNKAIEHARSKTTEQPSDESISVRSEYSLVKIPLNTIEYIESVQDYLKIHTTSGKAVMTLMTLKSILDKLPPDKFKRIHRSYVVPFEKVRSLGNRKIKLASIELPVSDTYINEVKDWMKQ